MERKRAASKAASRRESLARLEPFPLGMEEAALSEPDSPSSKTTRSRRPQVASACVHCRTAKVKCTGKHPSCSRCQKRNLVCNYDVAEEGVTRGQDVKRQLNEQTQTLNQVKTVLGVMQHGNDHEAQDMLARLRMGEDMDSLYKSVQAPHEHPLHETQTENLFGESDPLYNEVGQYFQDPAFVIPDPGQMPPDLIGSGSAMAPLETRARVDGEWKIEDTQALDPRLLE